MKRDGGRRIETAGRRPSRLARRRGLVGVAAVCWLLPAIAAAQARPDEARPRRQFVTLSLDGLHTLPLHFDRHPVEDLVGRAVGEAQRERYDYRSRVGLSTIDVREFRRRGRGAGITVYPFGMATGPALALRASYEDLPVIRLTIDGPAAVSGYALTDARAYDLGVGLFVADRAPGWAIGSYAFVGGGAGRIRSGLGDGRRIFGEAGGGVEFGFVGVQLAVKIAYNQLDAPVRHGFLTIPLALRGTIGF